jgi:hypothetical protein
MRWTAIGAVVAGAVALAAQPAGARLASDCSEVGSDTLRSNSVARVYQDRDGSTFSCSKRTAHREVLAGEMDELFKVRLRGHYVAYWSNFCLDALGDECDGVVALDDARSGRRLFTEVTPWDVPRLILRRDSALAWSEDHLGIGAIYKRDQDGRRRLDRGDPVAPSSLRLKRSTLSWRSGGERRTAVLR